MALNPEQKAANKESSLLRQAAYRARYKELEQAKLAIDVSSLEEAAAKARAEEDIALKTRNEAENAIHEQIAALQSKLKSVSELHAPVVDSARIARKEAYELMYNERARQTKEIESQFPDLSNIVFMGSGSWVPPPGYIEKFASEHAEELAKKKDQRAKKQAKNVTQ